MDQQIDYIFYKLFCDSKEALGLIEKGLANNSMLGDDDSMDQESSSSSRPGTSGTEKSNTSMANNNSMNLSESDTQDAQDKRRLQQLVTEITHRLVLLNYIIPQTYLNALDIIQRHLSNLDIWKKSQDSMAKDHDDDSEENSNKKILIKKAQNKGNLTNLGLFTCYEGNWKELSKSNADGLPDTKTPQFRFWHVNDGTTRKHKKKEFDDYERHSTDFDLSQERDSVEACVNLSTWHCNCAKYVLSKYQSRRITDLEKLRSLESGDTPDILQDDLDKNEPVNLSGWGQGYQGNIYKLSGQIPYCTHLLAVFVYEKGNSLFRWEKHISEGTKANRFQSLEFENEDDIVDLYEKVDVSSVSELTTKLFCT